MIGDSHILQVGRRTQNELLVGLYSYLKPGFLRTEDEDYAGKLATAVSMALIGEPATEQERIDFQKQNGLRVQQEAMRLSKDEMLCELLSGAAYNIGYGRYVEAGGGRLLNRYLGFIRAEAQKTRDFKLFLNMRNDLNRRNSAITRPLDALSSFQIWRSRPYNPNESAYYHAIQRFREAHEHGVKAEAAEMLPSSEMGTTQPIVKELTEDQLHRYLQARRRDEVRLANNPNLQPHEFESPAFFDIIPQSEKESENE